MKILLLVTEDWYFWSHRLSLARKLRDSGAEVIVMTRINDLGDTIRGEGFQVVPWDICKGSLNPIREASAIWQVIRAYRHTKPDLVHHVALKPIAYGGVAALICEIPAINTVAGLGEVFLSRSRFMLPFRYCLLALLRIGSGNRSSITILQNEQDRETLVRLGAIAEGRSRLIKGSGVDVSSFCPRPEPTGTPVVVLASRMLWSKGVGEFVEAARFVRQQGISARFALVGEPDVTNPKAITTEQLSAWRDFGLVEWWGHRSDMVEVFGGANVVCLPSYREGVPRVLVEAAACGRAIVTTDVPGCREIVRHGENGLLVPVRNGEALASAIAALLQDPAMRASMGRRGREIAVREFSEEKILRETLQVYGELLGSRWPDRSSVGAAVPAEIYGVKN